MSGVGTEMGSSATGGGFFSFEHVTLGGGSSDKADEPCLLPPGVRVQRIWLETQNPEDKADWLGSLLSIQTSRWVILICIITYITHRLLSVHF